MQPECIVTTRQPFQFNAQSHDCMCYIEVNNKIATFPNLSTQWNLPADHLLEGENPTAAALRILKAQTHLTVSVQQLSKPKKCYAQISGVDSIIYLFNCTLHQIPSHLVTATWVSIFAYRYLYLIHDRGLDLDALPPEDGRLQAFDILYHDRIWRPIPDNSISLLNIISDKKTLVLQKGNQKLEFNFKKRLIIPLLGIAASGKRTQSLLLEKALGLPSTSTRDLFMSTNQDMQNFTKLYRKTHNESPLPDEISIGLMAKQLSHPDCQAGVTIRGFPYTKTHCDVILNLFSRSTDLLIPLYLNIEDDISSRISQEQRPSAEMRTKLVLQNQDEVFQILQPKVLKLPATQTIAEVFHTIFQHIQMNLDHAAKEEEKKVAASSTPRKKNSSDDIQLPQKVASPPAAPRPTHEKTRLVQQQIILPPPEDKWCFIL